MLDSGSDIAVVEASVVDVPDVEDGMIGGMVSASVGGAEGTVGRATLLSVNTIASPSSSSTPQSTLSTPPSITHISTTVPAIPTFLLLPVVPFISVNMENHYAPLQLLINPGDMPQDYQRKIAYFDGTSSYTAQQHTKKIMDYFENYEIDDDDVRMKFFVQSLTGEVRTWFRALGAHTIANPDTLYEAFLNRWEKNKDPLHILLEYDTLKRGPQEAVQDYCARFNNVYTAIPQNLRPPPDLALIKFFDGFDPNMAYQLRERAPASLEDMQSIVASVEENLISKRARARVERRTMFKEECSTFKQKLDAIIKGMDRQEKSRPWTIK